MAPTYPITGIPMPAKPDPHHPIPLRREFTAWYSDPENAMQLSLFIQALIKFQQMSHTDKLSYYQVAGIHGYPATSWDGAEAPNPGDNSWYCNHNKTTFPTWHRPYMLLFEQRLYEIMTTEIIPGIQPDSERETWEIEASHWRLPYWDWAANQPYLQNVGIPELFTWQTVTVLMPNRRSQNFPNPLWKFSNPNGKPFGDASMGQWQIPAQPWNQAIGTSRHGTFDGDSPSTAWIQGENNFQSANASIQAHDYGGEFPQSWAISDLVSRLLTDDFLKSWRTFSSTAHTSQQGGLPPTEYLSLEQIHNDIHTFTGGSDPNAKGLGHMTDPAIASFDPIFFLHHCNVDRQFAMWQTINPEKWFDDLDPDDNNAHTPLSPFHKDTHGTIYTSNDARDWTKLNYQYDTLENTPRWIRAQSLATGNPVTQTTIAAHVRRDVNMKLNHTRHAILSAPSTLQGTENDYIVNVVYDRYALAGKGYVLHFFLGPGAPDHSTTTGSATTKSLTTHPTHAGSISTFSSALELSGLGSCANCLSQANSGLLSKALLILTPKLVSHCLDPAIPLQSMDPAHVEPYLAAHLGWMGVEVLTGRRVDLGAEMGRLKVYVLGGKGEHFEDPGRCSRYGGYGYLWGATEGRGEIGGARREDGDGGVHVQL